MQQDRKHKKEIRPVYLSTVTRLETAIATSIGSRPAKNFIMTMTVKDFHVLPKSAGLCR